MSEKWLNEEQAARHLGLSPNTLRGWRSLGKPGDGKRPPPFCKIGRRVRYNQKELDAWVFE